MSIALWVITGVLAAAFLAAAIPKLTTPHDKLAERMPWVGDFSNGQVKAIGAVEVLGAAGLILPGVTGIAPVLVPVAATGLALLMVLAATMHLRRSDGAGTVVPNVILFVLAVVVAWGRFGPYPL